MIRRIVLQHPNGIYQILGIGPVDEQGNDTMPDDYIPMEAGVTIKGIPTEINLVTSKRTYWLYKPVVAPQHTFDERQV